MGKIISELVFATGNRHKLEEVQLLMPEGLKLFTAAECGITEEIPEGEDTLEGNASAKAWYIYNKTGRNCFADDTGLEVTALNGAPGVHSARYAADNNAGEGHDSEANINFLLSRLQDKSDRSARFRTVISLIIEGVERQFEGTVEGKICTLRSGKEGFGYDPIFKPSGYQETFAEMSLDIKNKISHRGQATKKLADFLKNLNQ